MKPCIVMVIALLCLGCADSPTDPVYESGWTDNPIRPPQRRAPVATDEGGRVDMGYILVPYPKIVTAVPKRRDVVPEPEPFESYR